jgi:hypothetical protein
LPLPIVPPDFCAKAKTGISRKIKIYFFIVDLLKFKHIFHRFPYNCIAPRVGVVLRM